MLTESTRQKIDEVVQAATKEGYTFCGFTVNSDTTEVQPFTNHAVVGEFIYNLLVGAAMIADGMYDTAAIEKVAAEFLTQAKVTHEA